MNQSDIEFTVGLDLSPAEQKLDQFQNKMSMADAAFKRATGQPTNRSFDALKNLPGYKGFGFEQSNSYYKPMMGADNPIANAAKKLEATTSNFSSMIESKLRLQAERNAARSEYKAAYKVSDEVGMKTASKKYAEAEEGLKNISSEEKKQKILNQEEIKQHEITDETKEQSKEFNQHHIKLGKTITILYLIKKAVESIKKLWGQAFDIKQNVLKEQGYFSVDANAALNGMSQYTHSLMVAGERAMGKSAPFSMSDFDAASKTIQDMRLKAMAGEGIANEQYVIAMQRMFDRYGLGINATRLLSDSSVSSTDVMKQMLIALEDKVLPQLDKLTGVDRDLAFHDLSLIFGDKLMDSMVAHAIQRRITGGMNAVEEMEHYGVALHTNTPRIKTSVEVTKAFDELKSATELLKTTFLSFASGPLISLTNTLTNLAKWINGFVDNPKEWLKDPEKRNQLLENGLKIAAPIVASGVGGPVLGGAVALLEHTASKGAEKVSARSYDAIRGKLSVYEKYKKVNPQWKENASANLGINPIDSLLKANNQFENETWLEGQRQEAILQEMYLRYTKGTLGELASTGGDMGAFASIAQKAKGGLTYSKFTSWLKKQGDFQKQWKAQSTNSGSSDITVDRLGNLNPYIFYGVSPEAIAAYINNFYNDKKNRIDRVESIKSVTRDLDRNGQIDIGKGELQLEIKWHDVDNSPRSAVVPFKLSDFN